MNEKRIADLKNTVAAEATQPKSFIDMVTSVANKELIPLTNENGDIVGINCHKKVSGVEYAKMINGHLTVGATEKERAADEANLREFMAAYQGVPVINWFNAALKLAEANLTPVDYRQVGGNLLIAVVINKAYKIIDEQGHTLKDLGDVIVPDTPEAVIQYILQTEFDRLGDELENEQCNGDYDDEYYEEDYDE